MDVQVWLRIEPKEDVTGEGVSPALPSTEELTSRLGDILRDVTKHDGMTGWRVTGVRS